MIIGAVTYRKLLEEFAEDRYGLVTTKEAATLGVPAAQLPKLAARGWLTHLGPGLYRCANTPLLGSFWQFAEAVARVGPEAYLVQDAVLSMHDLALVNPRYIRVATTKRIRHQIPSWVKVVKATPATRVLSYEGVRSTSVAQALVDSRGIVMAQRLLDAVEEAKRLGLINSVEHEQLLLELAKPYK